jgi:hypothetical protein
MRARDLYQIASNGRISQRAFRQMNSRRALDPQDQFRAFQASETQVLFQVRFLAIVLEGCDGMGIAQFPEEFGDGRVNSILDVTRLEFGCRLRHGLSSNAAATRRPSGGPCVARAYHATFEQFNRLRFVARSRKQEVRIAASGISFHTSKLSWAQILTTPLDFRAVQFYTPWLYSGGTIVVYDFAAKFSWENQMTRRRLHCVLLCWSAVLILLVPLACFAQEATGKIVGTVYDQQGGVIPGTNVTVTNTGTGIAHSTQSDKDGFFQVLDLPIGTYRLTAEQSGFQRVTTADQKLEINQVMRIDVHMIIAGGSQTVTVEAQVAGVETANPTIGGSITSRELINLPLNGRDVLDLALTQTGVTEADPDFSGTGAGSQGGYSIAGGRPDAITFLLNGGLNNNLLDNSNVFDPNPDTVAEFRILKSDYTAEYGRNGGGIISVVTKSGSDQFHGSVFEFLRNDALNANLFFNNATPDTNGNPIPRPVLKRSQFGATLGGPIKKDKFFFFVGYQGQRQTAQENLVTAGVSTSAVTSVFTPAELQGNFSAAPDASAVAAFLQVNPYFQSNPALAAQGIIDPTKINPVSQNYINAGLIPTSPTGTLTPFGSATDNTDELTLRFDFNLNPRDQLTATIGGNNATLDNPFVFASVNGYPDVTKSYNRFINLGYTHVFSPDLLNEAHVVFQRNDYHQDMPAATLPTSADLGVGIISDNPTGPTNLYFGNNLTTGFSENGPTRLVSNTYAVTDAITYVHGKNTWKVGEGFTRYQNNTVYDYYINAELDFFGDPNTGLPFTGDYFADFLVGLPSGLTQYAQAPSNIRSSEAYVFGQDEWRVRPNLTLTIGLRYEFSSPLYDTQDRLYSISPGQQSIVFPGAPVGLVFPGDPGVPTGANFPDHLNFAPRFGFAWDPTGSGKTSIRGGGGIFYDVINGDANLQFNGQPPFFSAAGLFFSPNTSGLGPQTFLSDPFGNAGVPNPFPSQPVNHDVNFADAGFLPINNGGSQYWVDPHLKTPYVYQYNLSVQRELAPNLTAEVNYVGSTSHGLTALEDVNPYVLGTYNRILNLTPGNTTCSEDVGLCSFATVPEFKNVANANYNSLEASLTKVVSDSKIGTTYFTLGFTYAHSLDDASGFRNRNGQVPAYNLTQFYASSDFDIRDRIVFSGGWDLPFDRAWSDGPKRLTKGWSVYPIFSWRTGFPLDVPARFGYRFDPTFPGPTGAGDPYLVNALLVGPLNIFNPEQNQTINGTPGNYYFNPNSWTNAENPEPAPGQTNPCGGADPTIFPSNACAVANPAVRTYGFPRNSFRGSGRTNLDFALAKTTSITERVNAEFRVEAFNIFNHAEFQNPDTNITDGTFGQVTSTYDPRILQLALRVTF